MAAGASRGLHRGGGTTVGQTEDEIVNDMQAVREAENRLRSCAGDWRLFPYPTAPDDMKTLADAYILLTDPTPLTVELLVERGAQVEGNYYYFKGFFAYHSGGNRFDWYEITPGDLLQFPPRTVGELAMIELLMEGRS